MQAGLSKPNMAWLNFPAVELGFSLIFLWMIYRFLTASKRNKGKLGFDLRQQTSYIGGQVPGVRAQRRCAGPL
ncbi:hypothetical protein SUGI_0958090 [Cryptomeria japonica]|nr:hypothetical protein SUGI_0958090 [Cryptomeria japonica]